tara:strand:- start:346 stop:567 length:222 start_codon:yes stop_codon:yes gene_type:complete
MNKKVIAIAAALTLFGCATNKPNLEPLPPEKLQDLLHQPNKHFACSGCSKCKQVLWAYKSPTIKEIIGEKDFN